MRIQTKKLDLFWYKLFKPFVIDSGISEVTCFDDDEFLGSNILVYHHCKLISIVLIKESLIPS